MANKNLTFVETLTIEQFKARENVTKLSVKRNPHTDKMFFVFGSKTGAVALAGIPANPMVSMVETPEGKSFYLLHEESTGGAETLATF